MMKCPEHLRAEVSRIARLANPTPQPCEECGSTGKVHRHHDDYSKPAEIRWLCPRHHAQYHAKNRPASDLYRRRPRSKFQRPVGVLISTEVSDKLSELPWGQVSAVVDQAIRKHFGLPELAA